MGYVFYEAIEPTEAQHQCTATKQDGEQCQYMTSIDVRYEDPSDALCGVHS